MRRRPPVSPGPPGIARPVTRYGTAVLRRPCAPAGVFDASIQGLVADMLASMHAAGGVGLAASQIGVGLRVLVCDCPDAAGEHQAGHVVSPVLLTSAAFARPVTEPEACLSVPGQQASVTRAAVATAAGAGMHGHPVTVTGTGLLARRLQHETDHLRGTLYVDLLPPAGRAATLAAAGLPGSRGARA